MIDNYATIQLAHRSGDDVALQLRAHFSGIKPNMAIKCEIWDEPAGALLYSFVEQSADSLSAMVVRRINLPDAPASGLAVKAGFLWMDELGEVFYSGDRQLLPQPSQEAVPCTISVAKPRAKDGVETQLYYFRAGAGDYEYPNNRVHDGIFKVLLPFDGAVSLDSNEWSIDSIADGRVPEFAAPALTLFYNGGGSVSYRRDIISQLKITDSKTVSWSLNDDWNEIFVSKKILSDSVLEFYCKFYLRLQNRDDPSLFRYEAVVVSSIPYAADTSIQYAQIEPIRLFFGCVAGDTEILMADGSTKQICNIKVGDAVYSDAGGQRVTNVITGDEAALVHIGTENGRTIRVTKEHPVLTKRGFVRADCINAADMLAMHGGTESSIISLYIEGHNGKVYNLITDGPVRSLVGNGFVIGDMDMQNRMEREHAEPADYPDEVRAAREAFADLAGCIGNVGLDSVQSAVDGSARDRSGNNAPPSERIYSIIRQLTQR